MKWGVRERDEKSGCPFPETNTGGAEQSFAILRLHCGQYFPSLRRTRCTDFGCLQNGHRAHVCESIHSASSHPDRFTPCRHQAYHPPKGSTFSIYRMEIPASLFFHTQLIFSNNPFHAHPLAPFYKDNIPGTNKRLKHFPRRNSVCK